MEDDIMEMTDEIQETDGVDLEDETADVVAEVMDEDNGFNIVSGILLAGAIGGAIYLVDRFGRPVAKWSVGKIKSGLNWCKRKFFKDQATDTETGEKIDVEEVKDDN